MLAIPEGPSLPYAEIYTVRSVLLRCIPALVEERLRAALDSAKLTNAEFPPSRVRQILNLWIKATGSHDGASSASPNLEITKRYWEGLTSARQSTILSIPIRYYDTEKLFSEGGSFLRRVVKLREENKDDLGCAILWFRANPCAEQEQASACSA